jgi:hypothetical protein
LDGILVDESNNVGLIDHSKKLSIEDEMMAMRIQMDNMNQILEQTKSGVNNMINSAFDHIFEARLNESNSFKYEVKLRHSNTQRLNKLEKLIYLIDSPNKLSPGQNMKRLRDDENDKENYDTDRVSNSIFKKKHKSCVQRKLDFSYEQDY